MSTSRVPSRWRIWDLTGKVYGLPLYRLLGGPYRKEIELAACMGIQTYARAGEIARLYVEMGFSTLKTKAGRDPAEDLAMVRGVRDAVGDRLQLRIDPNTGYSPQVCEQLARDLEPLPAPVLRAADARRPDRRLGADPQAHHHAPGAERVGHDDGAGPRDPGQARRRTSSCPTRTSAAASGRRSSWPRSRLRRTCRAWSIAPTTWDRRPPRCSTWPRARPTSRLPTTARTTGWSMTSSPTRSRSTAGGCPCPRPPGSESRSTSAKVRKYQIDASC